MVIPDDLLVTVLLVMRRLQRLITVKWRWCTIIKTDQSDGIHWWRRRPDVLSERRNQPEHGDQQPARLPGACLLPLPSRSWRPRSPHTRRPVQHLPRARWRRGRRRERQKPARTICCGRCRLIVSASQDGGGGGACQRYLRGNKYLHSVAAVSRERP